MQIHGFMELTCPASGGRNTWPNIRDYGIGGWSRKKVAGNGQGFSVFPCQLIVWGQLLQAVERDDRGGIVVHSNRTSEGRLSAGKRT